MPYCLKMLIGHMSACLKAINLAILSNYFSQNRNGRRQVQNEVIEVSPNEFYAAAAKGIVMETNESYAAVCFSEQPPEYEEITL